MNPVIQSVTRRIVERSKPGRDQYLDTIQSARQNQPHRTRLSCTNFAHAVAAASDLDKITLHQERPANIGIVSAYNDMLSAHQPFDRFPEIIRKAARQAGATAQFAGGVPAMCDGVTQGTTGMELSLFSRDVIAMSTAVALSHDVFDAVICLGVCDKIVPGLLMGALSFGHLPTIFVPAGPMTSGIPNAEKARARQQFARGEIGRDELMKTECASYHGPGTCTFYGTANSNQMMMEIMGLHLPGSAFINPGDELRDHLTHEATTRALQITALGSEYTPIGQVVDEACIVNAIVGLLATGGSTNHTIHLIAIARCAGITIDWDDFSELSAVVPSLTRIYPNGSADVNQFHAAGGMALVINELLDAGLLHDKVATVAGRDGLAAYTCEPRMGDDGIQWEKGATASADADIIANHHDPFSKTGGITVLDGNLGRAIIKVSAVAPEHQIVEAPAQVFSGQREFLDAFEAGQLERDFIAVVINQGPSANGMPELHKLTPALGVLQDKGFRVALVTDGRMSGASGKVPAAIHVTPECACGGALSKVQNDDIILLDAVAGTLEVKVAAAVWQARPNAPGASPPRGGGREIFGGFRSLVGSAETGAVSVYAREQQEAAS